MVCSMVYQRGSEGPPENVCSRSATLGTNMEKEVFGKTGHSSTSSSDTVGPRPANREVVPYATHSVSGVYLLLSLSSLFVHTRSSTMFEEKTNKQTNKKSTTAHTHTHTHTQMRIKTQFTTILTSRPYGPLESAPRDKFGSRASVCGPLLSTTTMT